MSNATEVLKINQFLKKNGYMDNGINFSYEDLEYILHEFLEEIKDHPEDYGI